MSEVWFLLGFVKVRQSSLNIQNAGFSPECKTLIRDPYLHPEFT